MGPRCVSTISPTEERRAGHEARVAHLSRIRRNHRRADVSPGPAVRVGAAARSWRSRAQYLDSLVEHTDGSVYVGMVERARRFIPCPASWRFPRTCLD